MHYRWIMQLKDKDWEVRHIPGVENIVADYLSRYNRFEFIANMESDETSDDETDVSDIDELILNEPTQPLDSIQSANNNMVFIKDRKNRHIDLAKTDLSKEEESKIVAGKYSKKLYLFHSHDYSFQHCQIKPVYKSDSLCCVKNKNGSSHFALKDKYVQG